MGKKKSSKGKTVVTTDFFGIHYQPITDTGYSSDDEREESRAWAAERDRQKAASREAAALGQRRVQTAVLLGEENDFRTNLAATEKTVRAHLEGALSEERIEREWIEFTIARREEHEREERAKKAAFTPLLTQQMLHRADIADKETENRVSFFSGFAASMDRAEKAEKARVAREKAAERARAFEERARASRTRTEDSRLFQLVNPPVGNPAEATAPEATQARGWLSGWFSKA